VYNQPDGSIVLVEPVGVAKIVCEGVAELVS
jgi:hypothetical protein